MADEIFRIVLFALLFASHSAAVGLAACLATRLARRADPEARVSGALLSVSLGLGFVIDLTLASALAFLGVLTPVIVFAAAALSGGWAIFMILRHRKAWPIDVPKPERILLGLLFIIVLARAFGVPGRFFDDTMYHLPLARIIAEHHGLTVAPFIRYPLFPQAMEVLFAVGLMGGGVPAAQFIASWPLAIIILGLLTVSRMLFRSLAPGVLAVLLLASLWWLRDLVGAANVDLALGLFGSCALVAVLIADLSRSRRWLILAGCFAGAACAIKYFGLPITLLLGLYIALRRRSAVDLLSFGVAALLVGGAWYARNWAISGDPFHPVLGNLFGHYLWNAADLASQTETLRTIQDGSGSGTLALILRPKGLVLTALVALAALGARKRRPELLGISAVVLIYCLFWLATVRNNRYLLPALPAAELMIGALVAFACRPALRALRFRLRAERSDFLARTGAVVLGAIFAALAVGQAGANFQRRDQLLAAQAGHDAFALADRLRPTFGNRLVHLGLVSATYYFGGEAIGDWFGPGRYGQMLDCPAPDTPAHDCKVIDPLRMHRLLDRFGASMLVIDGSEFKFDQAAYARSFDIVYRGRDGSVLMTKRRVNARAVASRLVELRGIEPLTSAVRLQQKGVPGRPAPLENGGFSRPNNATKSH